MNIKAIKTLVILVFIVSVVACSNVKSTYDYDSSVNFSQLKTYQWDSRPSADFSKANPLIDKRVLKAINDNMMSKGLVEAQSADIKISYSVNFEKKIKTGGLSAGIGMSVGKSNRGSISLSSGNQLKQSTEGVLMIDMIATKTKKLIWRSITTKPVTGREATPEESQKRISQLVYRVFENFPPK